MDSGSDGEVTTTLPEIHHKVAASLWGSAGKMDRHYGRLLAPVKLKYADVSTTSDFKFRAGAPPRMPRAEKAEPALPVIEVPEPRRRWQGKTAKPRLAKHRESQAQVIPRPRRRADSTAAEAAFITEVLGADRVVVRGDDIDKEIAGRNEELAEFAKHRLDSRLHATQTSRRRAVQWRRQQTPGMRELPPDMPEHHTDNRRPAPGMALILKGVTCDTGALNVTFCPPSLGLQGGRARTGTLRPRMEDDADLEEMESEDAAPERSGVLPELALWHWT
eukprot:g28941.t1